jgi:foldase protein PrsA
MKNKKLIFIISGIVLAIILIVVGVFYYFNSKSYVAKVGSEEITTTEYSFFLGTVKSQMEQTVQSQGADVSTFWNSTLDGGKDAKQVAKEKALDEAQRFKIQLIKAKESGLKLSSTEKSDILKKIDDQVKQIGNTQVDTQLKQTYGITLKQYKDIIVDLNLVGKYEKQEEDKRAEAFCNICCPRV